MRVGGRRGRVSVGRPNVNHGFVERAAGHGVIDQRQINSLNCRSGSASDDGIGTVTPPPTPSPTNKQRNAGPALIIGTVSAILLAAVSVQPGSVRRRGRKACAKTQGFDNHHRTPMVRLIQGSD